MDIRVTRTKLRAAMSQMRTKLSFSGSKTKLVSGFLDVMDNDEAEARRAPVFTEPDSVVTDRSVDEVAKESGEWVTA